MVSAPAADVTPPLLSLDAPTKSDAAAAAAAMTPLLLSPDALTETAAAAGGGGAAAAAAVTPPLPSRDAPNETPAAAAAAAATPPLLSPDAPTESAAAAAMTPPLLSPDTPTKTAAAATPPLLSPDAPTKTATTAVATTPPLLSPDAPTETAAAAVPSQTAPAPPSPTCLNAAPGSGNVQCTAAAPSYASAAAVDILGAEDVGVASALIGKRRNSKGKGGKSGGRGSGGGGGGGSGGGGGGGGGGIGGGGGGGGGSSGNGGGGNGGGRGGAVQRGGSGGGQRQQQRGRSETPMPQQLREWFAQRGASGGSVRCPYVIHIGDRAGQTCEKLHTQHRCFSSLDDAWCAEFGDEAERTRWAELLRSRVDIYALEYDAILAAMYALSVPAESASESALPGTAPAEALHTFTLDLCASRCFFRDSTTLTPLPAPVPVRLADPSRGPDLARSSTVLPCPALPSGSLSGLHLPSFSTNLVSTTAPQDVMVTTTTPGGQRVSICTCTQTGRHLAMFTRRPGSSLYTLTTEPPQVDAFSQGSTPCPVATPRSCRLLSHQTLLWHHRLGHPSLPRHYGMHSRLLVSERRIGSVMEVARTSMIHAAAPHFLWPFDLAYTALDDASVFRVWGSRAFVRDTSADKVSSRTIPCLFLGFPRDAPGLQFYHPTSRRVLHSQDVTFDEVLLPKVCLRGVAFGGAASGGAEPASAEPGGTEPEGAEPGGAESEGAESGGAELGGAEPGDTKPEGAEPWGPVGASPRLSPQREPLSPQQLREWFAQRTRLRSGAAGAEGSAAGGTGAGGAGVTAGAGDTAGPGAAGPGGARTRGTGATGAGGVGGTGAGDPTARNTGAGGPGAGDPTARDTGAGGPGARDTSTGAKGAGAGGTGAGDPGARGTGGGGAGAGCTGAGGSVRRRPFFVPPPPSSLPPPYSVLRQVLSLPSSTGLPPILLSPPPHQSQPQLQPDSPLPAPSPYAKQADSFTECREPESRPASPVRAVRTGRRVPRPPPLPVPALTLWHFVLPLCHSDPTVPRLLSIAVTDPSFESTAASALVAELVEFAAACCLNYATNLTAESASASPPSVGDPDAPDIPTPHSYAEAITGPYSFQWQAAMDAEMASWKSTGTYVDEVPPLGSSGTTLAALGFAPSTADPSLFLRTDTSLPSFYVLVYVDDLVLATADIEALTLVKSELQK
ncbi:unnamed protein product [Closterium sp. NIES-54]